MDKTSNLQIATLLCLATGSSFATECDLDYAKDLYEQCAACHTYVAGDLAKSGPNLRGLFGRLAGSVDYPIGFSKDMTESGIVWDAATLDQFLKRPAAIVRSTTMLFVGISDAEDRAELICYLKKVTLP